MRTLITAEEVKTILHLEPHPREGGWYTRTYEADEQIAVPARYKGARLTGTAIYYLLEQDTFSEMHRLQSDELFHFYMGDPVEMLRLYRAGHGERVILGHDLAAGERPQTIVPRGVWQGTRMLPGGAWALLGCTVSPGFEFEDYESGHRAQLSAGWPAWAVMIEALTNR